MAITLTQFPSGFPFASSTNVADITFLSGFPFATSTKTTSNAFPTGDSFPDMRQNITITRSSCDMELTGPASEFSSLPSTVTSVFSAVLNAHKSGLSTDATVGVSIGAAVAGLIIIGLIILLWKRKQKTNRSKSLNSEEKAIAPSGNGPGNISPVSDGTSTTNQAEMDGEVVHATGGAWEPQKLFEADHTHTRAELDSGWRGWEALAIVETAFLGKHQSQKTQ